MDLTLYKAGHLSKNACGRTRKKRVTPKLARNLT